MDTWVDDMSVRCKTRLQGTKAQDMGTKGMTHGYKAWTWACKTWAQVRQIKLCEFKTWDMGMRVQEIGERQGYGDASHG